MHHAFIESGSIVTAIPSDSLQGIQDVVDVQLVLELHCIACRNAAAPRPPTHLETHKQNLRGLQATDSRQHKKNLNFFHRTHKALPSLGLRVSGIKFRDRRAALPTPVAYKTPHIQGTTSQVARSILILPCSQSASHTTIAVVDFLVSLIPCSA
jgi:hypothetical protein